MNLLEQLRAEGFVLRPVYPDAIAVSPAALLTDSLRARIRAHRTELLRLLGSLSWDKPPGVDNDGRPLACCYICGRWSWMAAEPGRWVCTHCRALGVGA